MQRGCNITFQRRSLLHYWNWCSLILSPYTPINHLKDPASAPRDPGSRRGNKRCKLVAYCLKYKSLLLRELVLTGTGKWLHFSENLCRCQSWEIFVELPSRQTCSKTRLCDIHRYDIHITAVPIFASKEIKTKTSALPLAWNPLRIKAMRLPQSWRWHASHQLLLPLCCGSGADGTANRMLTRNILQPRLGSCPSHPCALVTIVMT